MIEGPFETVTKIVLEQFVDQLSEVFGSMKLFLPFVKPGAQNDVPLRGPRGRRMTKSIENGLSVVAEKVVHVGHGQGEQGMEIAIQKNGPPHDVYKGKEIPRPPMKGEGEQYGSFHTPRKGKATRI